MPTPAGQLRYNKRAQVHIAYQTIIGTQERRSADVPLHMCTCARVSVSSCVRCAPKL